jgi:adenosylcobinamide-GDP ribazoletransferase
MIKKQSRIFPTALMFFTRIPCPEVKDFKESDLNEATRYFSLIGVIVGSIGFGVFYALQFLLPVNTAIILSLASTVITTGAFHEDGFADMLDGFGGGWTKEKILEIMKDSRIGAFGAIGLIFLFAIKISLLINIIPQLKLVYVFALFLCMHSLSRAAASSLILSLRYVQEDTKSKIKPLTGSLSTNSFIFIMFWGCAPLFLFYPEWKIAIISLPTFLVALLMGKYMKNKIGGYTGDCLGATQQVCEIVFLVSISAALKLL